MYEKVNCQWPEHSGVLKIAVPHFKPLPYFRPYLKTKRNVPGKNFPVSGALFCLIPIIIFKMVSF